MGRIVIAATSAYALFTTLLMILTLAGIDSFTIPVSLLFLGFAAMGLVIPWCSHSKTTEKSQEWLRHWAALCK
jgi:hypothetical protein